MGAISKKLAARFSKKNSNLGTLRHRMKPDFARLTQEARQIADRVETLANPLHKMYASAQNFTSIFAEVVSAFPEFKPYANLIEAADEEYMPSGPPMSPLTNSYFTTWAFFDARFGPSRETIGTCLLDVADLLNMDAQTIETLRQFQNSRMGIYEFMGVKDGHAQLQELVTGEEFRCYVASGYRGRPGELWYVRRCPPVQNSTEYHVIFTTPYVLIQATKTDWTAYLRKSQIGATDPRQAFEDYMKYGKKAQSRNAAECWNEFVFQAYSNHQHEAIYLTGLPDVKGSLPHS